MRKSRDAGYHGASIKCLTTKRCTYSQLIMLAPHRPDRESQLPIRRHYWSLHRSRALNPGGPIPGLILPPRVGAFLSASGDPGRQANVMANNQSSKAVAYLPFPLQVHMPLPLTYFPHHSADMRIRKISKTLWAKVLSSNQCRKETCGGRYEEHGLRRTCDLLWGGMP